VVGSLLVPAITKQWSDRPRELEIKTTLVREISELTTDTVTAHVTQMYSATPTARVLQMRITALKNARSKADKAEAQKRYDAALDANLKESQTILSQKWSIWKTKGAAIRAQLSAYFSGTQLTSNWDALAVAMVAFMRLASNACDRSGDVGNVRSFLASDQTSASIQWQLLEKSIGTDSGCFLGNAKLAQFRYTYEYVGGRLILKQQQILDSIMKADMVGFSRGWHDLVKDVMSGGS
jgi:hypothetical protein